MNNVNNINLNQLKIKKGDKVVDMGCSFGDQALKIAKEGMIVYGIDKDEQAISQFKESAKKENVKCILTVGDIEEMPYADNQFDVVIATEVIEHVHNPEKAIKESIRILRPGGHACISVPTLFSEQVFRFLHPTWIEDSKHLNFFSKNQILTLLKEAGYVIERVENHNFEWSIFWLVHSFFRSRFRSTGTPTEHRNVSKIYFKIWAIMRKIKIDSIIIRCGNRIFPKSYYIYATKIGKDNIDGKSN